jgi:hypothetical protein
MTALGASTYTWSTNQQGSSVTVLPPGSTSYTVTGGQLTNTCVSEKVFTVTVTTPTLGVSPPASICEGAVITLTAGPGSNAVWNPGANPFPSLTTSPSVTTEFTVTADVVSEGITCPAKATVLITVNPNPVVTASASRTLMCKGESIALTAGGALTYSWSNNQSGASATFTSNSVVQQVITVTGTDLNGCKGTNSVTLKVNACNALPELSANGRLRIYPNPSSGVLNIEASSAGTLNVMNALGALVKRLELSASNQYKAVLNDLSSGVYLISDGRNCYKAVIE